MRNRIYSLLYVVCFPILLVIAVYSVAGASKERLTGSVDKPAWTGQELDAMQVRDPYARAFVLGDDGNVDRLRREANLPPLDRSDWRR